MGSCCVCGEQTAFLYLGELCCMAEDCVNTLDEQIDGGGADLYYE